MDGSQGLVIVLCSVVDRMNKNISPQDLSLILYRFIELTSVKSRVAAPRIKSTKAEK